MTRLIDADELKKAIAEFHQKENDRLHNHLWSSIGLNALNRLIDNAPTVEPDMEFAKWVTEMIFGNNEVEDFDFELFSELACRKLEKLGLVEKTEGEWIEFKGGYYKCDKCGEVERAKKNFCSNCGADMRGEE